MMMEERLMNNFFIVFLIFTLTSLISEVFADEKNFGKTVPSVESIINQFKKDDQDTSSQFHLSESFDDTRRGLNIIEKNKKTSKWSKPSQTTQQSVGDEKAISLEILFNYNSTNLTEDAKTKLAPVSEAMLSPELNGFHYRIEGYTDIVGSDQFNVDLSLRRALAVKEFLTNQSGVSTNSLQTIGKGKSNLADANHPYSEANRRVRIVRLLN